MTHGSMPPAPPRLDHLSLPVSSLDRSLPFYRDVLGMTVAWRDESMVLLKAGGTELALNESARPPQIGHALHFGFRACSLDEVDRWAAHLQASGVSGVRMERAPGVSQLYFEDPDGYTLEIYFPGS